MNQRSWEQARGFALTLCFALLPGTTPLAHEVLYASKEETAFVIRFYYPDGRPFAFEAFEAYPEGAQTPTRAGRTDEEGRAVFLPGTARNWRIRAFSPDGHGIETQIAVPAPPSASATVTTSLSTSAASLAPTTQNSLDTPQRWPSVLLGLSIVLALFGLWQLWLRKNK